MGELYLRRIGSRIQSQICCRVARTLPGTTVPGTTNSSSEKWSDSRTDLDRAALDGVQNLSGPVGNVGQPFIIKRRVGDLTALD